MCLVRLCCSTHTAPLLARRSELRFLFIHVVHICFCNTLHVKHIKLHMSVLYMLTIYSTRTEQKLCTLMSNKVVSITTGVKYFSWKLFVFSNIFQGNGIKRPLLSYCSYLFMRQSSAVVSCRWKKIPVCPLSVKFTVLITPFPSCQIY